LNSYYRATRNDSDEPVSPPANGTIGLQLDSRGFTEEPVFFSVDDTTVPKFGTKERAKLELAGDFIEEVMPLLKYQNPSPQELRSHISWQIQREIFFALWSRRPKMQKNPIDLVRTLCKVLYNTNETRKYVRQFIFSLLQNKYCVKISL